MIRDGLIEAIEDMDGYDANDLEWSELYVREITFLGRNGVTLWSQIEAMTAAQFLAMPGIGMKTFRRVSELMAARGKQFVPS